MITKVLGRSREGRETALLLTKGISDDALGHGIRKISAWAIVRNLAYTTVQWWLILHAQMFANAADRSHLGRTDLELGLYDRAPGF